MIIGVSFALLFSLIPILKYYIHFKEFPLSDKPGDWGAFGDYIGGISGTLLNFFAVTFSLISIYLTTRVAKQIQDNEFRFNEIQSKNQLDILFLQNKPYPYLDLAMYHDQISIIIQNMGLGPLIITKWKISYLDKEEYSSFNSFFDSKLKIKSIDTTIRLNSAPAHILAPNKEKELLWVKPSASKNENFLLAHNEIRNLLKDTEITIEYEDIFKNQFVFKKKLNFFK